VSQSALLLGERRPYSGRCHGEPEVEMLIPKSVASFNKKVTNHVSTPFAGHLPGFVCRHHTSRTTLGTDVSDSGQRLSPRR
jgi:hypothetical protein